MPSPEHNSPPDVVVGRHPRFGIVATNPKNLAASAWMLTGFGFQPVPGHPSLYALADQHDGRDRTARFITLLRKARYRSTRTSSSTPRSPPHGRFLLTRLASSPMSPSPNTPSSASSPPPTAMSARPSFSRTRLATPPRPGHLHPAGPHQPRRSDRHRRPGHCGDAPRRPPRGRAAQPRPGRHGTPDTRAEHGDTLRTQRESSSPRATPPELGRARRQPRPRRPSQPAAHRCDGHRALYQPGGSPHRVLPQPPIGDPPCPRHQQSRS